MQPRFSDQTVIITGGATGLGANYVRAFHAEGASVVMADLAAESGQTLAEELSRRERGQAIFVRTDVADEEQTQRMASVASEIAGRIDVLVNNAAVYGALGRKKPFDEITKAEWDLVMAVNVRGVWNCIKAVAPYMKRQKRGKIVNVGSVVFNLGAAGFAHYVASKAAVIGLTRALARELGSYNVTVNAVSPGLVENEASRQLNPSQYFDDAARTRALSRSMAPEDLLGAVLFFASAASDFISGQTLVVDGGGMFD
jgi:NAD(P)-dependent dehydrogenase (short-subunit alcohol dehydrogenase family)